MIVGLSFPGAKGIDLLWTNSSPSANFGAKTVPIDLSTYDAVLIVCLPDISYSSTEVGPAQIFFVGTKGEMFMSTAKSTTLIARRNISVDTTGVTFANGRYWAIDANITSSEKAAVPYKIFGLSF